MRTFLLFIGGLCMALYSCRTGLSNHDAGFDVTKAELSLSPAYDVKAKSEVSDPGFFAGYISVSQPVILNYISSGCFHYQNEKVKISKIASGYLVDYIKIIEGTEVKVIDGGRFGSHLGEVLKVFNEGLKKSFSKDFKWPAKNIFFSTSSYSLTIHDGLHLFPILVDEEYNPFEELTRYLNEMTLSTLFKLSK